MDPILVKFPEIEQFRQTSKEIKQRAQFVGTDEFDNIIVNRGAELPVVDFSGTVKLHGTNGGVCYSKEIGIYCQSRTKILSLENDNLKFCEFVTKKEKDSFQNLFNIIEHHYNIDVKNNIITLFGEYCGKGINKGTGIQLLDRMFVIIGLKITPLHNNDPSYWLDYSFEQDIAHGTVTALTNVSSDIYNIKDFKTFDISIDFNNIKEAKDTLDEYTQEVEDRCPVASDWFSTDDETELVGEGIVWTGAYKGKLYRFKTKGEKHAKLASKKKREKKQIDTEKLTAIDECVEKITHDWRFQQALVEVFGMDYEDNIDIKKLGEYLKWVNLDTIKEESDIILNYNLSIKDISGKLNNKAKEYFFEVYNKEL